MGLKAHGRLLKQELNLVVLVLSRCLVDRILSRLKTECFQLVLARLEWVVEEFMGVISEILNLIIDHEIKIEVFE